MMLKKMSKKHESKSSLYRIRKVAFALTLVASAAFFAGCSDDDAGKGKNDEVSTGMNGSEKKEQSISNDETVFIVDGTNITAGEARWYVYMLADSIKEDAVSYEKETGKSYYDAVANDEGETVEQALRRQVVDMIYYYEILYNLALKDKNYQIEDESFFEEEAAKKMEEAGEENIKKYSLTQDAYALILKKWSLADMYYEEVAGLYDVDRDELMKSSYTDEQLKTLKQEEYDAIADELARNYKKQLFNSDFEEIQEDHEIKVINDKWEMIQIHD